MSDFSWTAPASTVTWSAGSIRYNGTDHAVSAGNAGASGERWIYWESDDPTAFSDTTTPTIDKNRWYVMYYDGSNLHPTLQGTIVHAGVLQAGTVVTDHMTANTINGDRIQGNTLDIAKLNFTPLTSSGATGAVIATINASAEGIDIEADNISISGVTTFSAGWANATNAETDIDALDLQNAPAEAGATADQTSTEIIDATGWEYGSTTEIDGGEIHTNTVLAEHIGTDSALVSEIFALDVTVGSEIKSTAKDSYGDTTAGFWLGMDSGTPKFNIGDATHSLKWDGTDLIINGDQGTLGTSTQYFDIANGELRIGTDADDYVEIDDYGIELQKSGGTYSMMGRWWNTSGKNLLSYGCGLGFPSNQQITSATYATIELTYNAGKIGYTAPYQILITGGIIDSIGTETLFVKDESGDTVINLESDGSNDISIFFKDDSTTEWEIEWDETNNTISIIETGVGTHFKIEPGGGVFMPNMESGNAEPATVDAGELWYDTNNNNIVKMGT